jgi:hypothetical protein
VTEASATADGTAAGMSDEDSATRAHSRTRRALKLRLALSNTQQVSRG